MTWLNLCFKVTLVTVDWGVGPWLQGAKVEEGNQLGCYSMREKDDLGQGDGGRCRRYIWGDNFGRTIVSFQHVIGLW